MTNARNIAERVVWTFIQGAVGAIPLTFVFDPHNLDAAERVGWIAVAGGIAAVISLAKNLTKAPVPALTATPMPVPTVVVNNAPPVNLAGGSASARPVKKPPAKKASARAR
jgi:hypothetical protein